MNHPRPTGAVAPTGDAVAERAYREDPIGRDADPGSSADVVVIGGGIVGAATAWYLASRGVSVTLLEKGWIAGEQSGRNWGWVRQQNRDLDELRLMIEGIRIWERLESELGADIEWVQGGNLALARDPARIRFFEEWHAAAGRLGVDSRLLSPSEIREMLPGLAGDWLGAIYTPTDGHAEPALATRALARAARRRGATIVEGCAVDRIVLSGRRVVGVETERGRIRADHVVCAAGVWTARLLRSLGVELPVRIVRSTAASTEPVEPITEAGVGYHPVVSFRQRRDGTLYVAAGGWSDYDITLESFRHLRYFVPNYLKNRRLIRIHVGRPLLADVARAVAPWTADRQPWRRARVLSPPPSEEKVRTSVAEFRRMFPSIPIRVRHAWAGYIDTTPDAIPVIDRLSAPAGLTVAAGFSGHGFAMGPIVGRVVAELIADGRPSLDLAAFRLGRFRDGTYKKPRLVA
ncbi:MAG TPA: FAD-binding oxidoreductase [Candidatus Limnocylindrales bacterium]|nr:FAD-binding oxidoreductase [Candidatus Limnocylindrales bacterium]